MLSPILTIALTANAPVRDITEYADKVLRRQLESADGVGQVLVLGGRRRQINVVLDADRLRAQNLTVNDVARALQAQNSDIPGGRIDQGAQSLTMRTRGRVESPDEFGGIVIREVSGYPVQVRDVARIEDGMAEAQTVASVNGDPTVLLQIRKQSGTNTVEIVNAVKARLMDVERTLPAGYRLRIVRDQAEFIEASITSVEEHLVVGSILAALVVLLFLGNLRSTVIAAISIPTSIIATFGLIWYMGFTLNMLTMLALTLSVGIVIDDAIVVLENIYRFIEEKGMPPMEAAVEATREIGLAVLATTLSLVAIFVPVGFMSGMVGRFMQSFGLTMAFAILVSLLVSFTLTPMMSSRWLKVKRAGAGGTGHDSKHSAIFGPMDRVYAAMLGWSMSHRWVIGVVAVAVLLSSVPLFRFVAVTFLTQDDQSGFDVNVRASEGTSLEATEVMANRIGAAIRRIPEVNYTLATVAGDGAGTRNSASIFVKLHPIEARERDQFAVMAQVRDEILARFTAEGVRASVGGGGGGGGPGGGVQFVLRGPELRGLQEYSERLLEKVKTIPGVVDADTTLNAGKPEVSVRMDRPKAADLGVPLSEAAEALRLLVSGDAVTTYNEGGEQYRGPRACGSGRPWFGGGAGPAADTVAGWYGRARGCRTVYSRGGVGRYPTAVAAAPSDRHGESAARHFTGGRTDADDRVRRSTRHGARLYRRVQRPVSRTESYRHRVSHSFRAFVDLHVPGTRRAVRVVAPPGDDSALAAADAAFRPALAHRLSAVVERVLRARSARAVRRGQEEFNPADRSCEPAQSRWLQHARRHRAGQPQPPAADSDDDAGVCGRHGTARRDERRRFSDQSCDWLGGDWRPDAGARTHPCRDARGLRRVRRSAREAPGGKGRGLAALQADGGRTGYAALGFVWGTTPTANWIRLQATP